MAQTNLRDGNIFADFVVFIRDVGKIGEAPGFQPPEVNIQVEEFRGGGMDGTVEIPMGIEKIEFSFDLHTWDAQIWNNLGYGPGALDVPIHFAGYLITPGGAEKSVSIRTRSLIKSIKPDSIEVGRKAKVTTTCVANYFAHEIDGQMVCEIDVFNKMTRIGGRDRSQRARQILGFV